MLRRALNWSGRVAAKLYAGGLLQMDVRRHAPLPPGARIVAANHPTTTDPFLLMGLIPEAMSVLITDSCFKVPLLGGFLRGAGHVPVVDGNGRAAFEAARALLERGGTVGIFPEGALSPLEGGLCPLHTGVARLALCTGAPVIPVGIGLRREGIYFRTAEIDGVTEHARFYLRGPYAVTVGEPLSFTGDVADRAHVRAVAHEIARGIAQLAQESAHRLQAQGSFRRARTRVAPCS